MLVAKGVDKLVNLKREMDRHNLDIIGIREMRYPKEGDFWLENSHRSIHTASVDGMAGMGIIMNKKKIGQRVNYYLRVSKRKDCYDHCEVEPERYYDNPGIHAYYRA